MTHDPEAAERLARRLLWAFGDSPLAADAAALIRAQAAEIARLTEQRDNMVAAHALAQIRAQRSRNAALREAVNCFKDEDYIDDYEYSGASALKRKIEALIDTPAPPTPAEPAGDATKAMVDAAFKALPADADGTIGAGEMYRVLDAALAAAPAPQPDAMRDETIAEHVARDMREGRFPERSPRQQVPAPQPDADEREAMVAVIAKARGRFLASELAWAGDVYHDEERRIADALIADGWARKREEN